MRGAMETEAKLQQTSPIFREQEAAWKKLTDEGFAGRLYWLERQRARIENEQDMRTQQYAVASLKATIVQSERKIDQITSGYRQQLQNERIETAAQLHKLEQESDKQAHQHGLLELKAPQAGIVWTAIVDATTLDLTVRSNSSVSSGLKSRPRSCPYALVA